ncbi:Small ribosomal subunit protein [Trichinella spiralis]|uniref:Small ribosomal subunit protein n=1 Tax=Trichinella spiralis TaxID=6334 RepID=A0ABR3KHS0_TRISP
MYDMFIYIFHVGRCRVICFLVMVIIVFGDSAGGTVSSLNDRLSCSLVCRRWFNLLGGELRSLTSLELVFVGDKCDAELYFGPSMHFGAVCLSMSLCACQSHRLRRRQLLDMVLGISGQYLRSIFIDDHILSKTEYALDPVIFRMLFDTCPHLDTLHMDNLTVPVNCQLTLFRIGELKRLQILRLVDCHPMHVFNDRLLFSVIKNNTLRELTVSGSTSPAVRASLPPDLSNCSGDWSPSSTI